VDPAFDGLRSDPQFRALVDDGEPSAQAWFFRGNAHYEAREYEDAVSAYHRSLELRPDDADTLNNRGDALCVLGRYREALADYNRSLEVRPHHPAVLNNRGAALYHLGRHEEAVEDYNSSLELYPDSPGTLYNRACLFAVQEKVCEALDDLGRATTLDAKYRELARTDPDFDSIRNGPGFKALVEGGEPPPEGASA
jgi:tetratricopeptide (TPR) repeat protein